MIYIDNLNRMLASGALAAALTTREFSDRVLGKSEQVSLPVRCVWVAASIEQLCNSLAADRADRVEALAVILAAPL